MRYRLIVALVASSALVSPVAAETLQDALANAYANNPALEAARAQQRAVDEGVSQARGGWRPQIEASGSIGRSWTSERIDLDGNITVPGRAQTAKTYGVSMVQPVFRGLRTVNEVSQAKNQVMAGRESLLNAEQQVLLDAVTAYMNVKRDEAVLELNRNNVQVLQRQLDATRDRFNVGEVTRTDVAQSEARLSRAISDRTSAEAALTASRAFYKRVIGDMPGTLAEPAGMPPLPETEDYALETALADNPLANAARYAEKASSYGVGAAASGLLPQVNLRAGYNRSLDTSPLTPDLTTKQVVAELRVPLYEAGVQSSLTRQARQINSQRKLLIVDAERTVTEGLRNAWENLREARSRLQSDQAQARASEIALDGVRQEAEVGARTTLDVLNAEQEALDARVALVRTHRDEVVASYGLLSAMGHLTAEKLNLPVAVYDPARNYDRVSDQIWGWGIEDE